MTKKEAEQLIAIVDGMSVNILASDGNDPLVVDENVIPADRMKKIIQTFVDEPQETNFRTVEK